MCRSRVQRLVVIWQRSSISSIFSRVIRDLLITVPKNCHFSVPLVLSKATFRSRVGMILCISCNRWNDSFCMFLCAFSISSYAFFISLEDATRRVSLLVGVFILLTEVSLPLSSQRLSSSAPNAARYIQVSNLQFSSFFGGSSSIVTSYSYSKKSMFLYRSHMVWFTTVVNRAIECCFLLEGGVV